MIRRERCWSVSFKTPTDCVWIDERGAQEFLECLDNGSKDRDGVQYERTLAIPQQGCVRVSTVTRRCWCSDGQSIAVAGGNAKVTRQNQSTFEHPAFGAKHSSRAPIKACNTYPALLSASVFVPTTVHTALALYTVDVQDALEYLGVIELSGHNMIDISRALPAAYAGYGLGQYKASGNLTQLLGKGKLL